MSQVPNKTKYSSKLDQYDPPHTKGDYSMGMKDDFLDKMMNEHGKTNDYAGRNNNAGTNEQKGEGAYGHIYSKPNQIGGNRPEYSKPSF
jgi:hypothetical protein